MPRSMVKIILAFQELQKVLQVVSRKSPRLEILTLDSNVFRATEYIDYCKRWKYLRFIINLEMIVSEFKVRYET